MRSQSRPNRESSPEVDPRGRLWLHEEEKATFRREPGSSSFQVCLHVSEFVMKAGLLLLAISSLLAASDKAPAGEIIDPQALAKVRSFCVDLRDLSGFDRHLVKDFLKAEGKPKHLLTKLPWKLVPECEEGASDAVAKVEFVRVWSNRERAPEVTVGQDVEKAHEVAVALQVVDASSQESLYRVQAGPVMNTQGSGDAAGHLPTSDNTNPVLEQRDALYHAFWALVDDVRQLPRTQ